MVATATPTEELIPPKEPREWSLAQIERVLSRPIPHSMLKTKYAPGWTFDLTQFEIGRDVPFGNRRSHRVFIVGRLTIPTSEGNVYRESCGTESLDCNSYGDPSSNAESMAFRRCCARFGLGLYLYEAK